METTIVFWGYGFLRLLSFANHQHAAKRIYFSNPFVPGTKRPESQTLLQSSKPLKAMTSLKHVIPNMSF